MTVDRIGETPDTHESLVEDQAETAETMSDVDGVAEMFAKRTLPVPAYETTELGERTFDDTVGDLEYTVE